MQSARQFVFVGCLNRPAPYFAPPRGRGIAVLSFDPETGALQQVSEVNDVDNPTFLAVSVARRTLYATSEVFGWREGVVSAYAIGEDGSLSYINKQPTRGSLAAHAAIDPSGSWLIVTNYQLGLDGTRPSYAVVTFPIEPDGGLGPPAGGVFHNGSGPARDRQERAHPHCALPTPDGSHVLVSDLGIDRIIVYRFCGARGHLRRVSDVSLPEGCGPRHLAWARPGVVVATGELDNTTMSLAWNGASLRLLSVAPLLPAKFLGESHAADIHAAPDGRYVYASNRGGDSIATLSVDESGRLSPSSHRRTGRTPRNFTLDQSGRHVLVACQDGHEVIVHRRDNETGALSEPIGRVGMGSPMCVKIAAL